MRLIFLALVLFLIKPSLAFANSCTVTLQIERVYGIPLLGKDHFSEDGVNYDLSVSKIDAENKVCDGYKDKSRFEMNAVHTGSPKIANLKVGQKLEGTLNYHMPSPHGKILREEYHNGFRIIKVWNDKEVVEDYSQEYVYYRHIGVFE